MTKNHRDNPELWLRPSPKLPFEVLSTLIESRLMTATPRLGARDNNHPKGYEPGQVVTLKVLDGEGGDFLHLPVLIKQVIVRQLSLLTENDLQRIPPYHDWREVQHDFSLFEGRPIGETEEASIIEFSYL